MEKININEIKNHALFDGINSDDLPGLISCIGAHKKFYTKGDTIFFFDESIKYVGIILSGQVRIIKEYEDGEQSTLINLEKGDLLGEFLVCGRNNKSEYLFTAAKSCEIMFLPFHRVINSCSMTCTFHHRLIENMVKLLSYTSVRLMNKVEIISRKTLRDKILTYLKTMSEEYDSSEFTIPMGRNDLANYLCTNRSALTRELVKLKDEHVIDFEKNTFKLY